jgi:hypothetical protein
MTRRHLKLVRGAASHDTPSRPCGRLSLVGSNVVRFPAPSPTPPRAA